MRIPNRGRPGDRTLELAGNVGANDRTTLLDAIDELGAGAVTLDVSGLRLDAMALVVLLAAADHVRDKNRVLTVLATPDQEGTLRAPPFGSHPRVDIVTK